MSTFTESLERLNDGQRKAVEALQGPVLVVAGPGTGKTQVLAMRIANILKNTDTNASNILCLTFTEAAVLAMRQRLQRIIGNEAFYIRIHTFHGFCNEVIQKFADKFAFARELIQLSDLQKIKLMREILDGIDPERKFALRPFFDKYRFQRDILSAIQTLKRESVLPDDLENLVKTNLEELNANPNINKKTGKPTLDWNRKVTQAERQLELVELYRSYQELLTERGYYDYEDMILFVIQKFQEDEELLAHYQERFLHILVDEYQDTNGAQNEIVRLLGSFDESPNVFVVGDDDQAIYRFQGANVENLLDFTKHFKNVQTVAITENYRSSQVILDAAEAVIEQNKERLVNFIPELSKHLKSKLQIPEEKLQVYQFGNQETENRFIVDKVTELMDKGIQPAEIAILYRRHSDVDDVAEALLKADVPLRLAVGQNALDEVVIMQLLNLLRVIQFEDPDRDKLLTQILFYDFLGIDRLDAFKTIRFCGEKRVSIMDLATKPELETELRLVLSPENKVFELLQSILAWKQAAANHLLIELIEIVSRDSKLLPSLLESNGESHLGAKVEDLNALNSFFDYVRSLNRQNRAMTLQDLLADLNLLTQNNLVVNEQELDINRQGVQLMTAHSAKGLEFKHVFIVKCHDDNWGSKGRSMGIKLPEEIFTKTVKSGDDLEVEDERRLFYVALTRAQEQIYITSAKSYVKASGEKEVAPSRFITEINPNCIIHPNIEKYEEFDLESTVTSLSPRVDPPYTETEKEYLKCLIEDFVLSPSALNDYIECPLKFKFERLLLVPRLQDKTQILGTAIHYALEHFMRHLQAGELKGKDYITFLFKTSVEKELMNKEDQLQTIAEGTEIISGYYDRYLDEFAAPAEIEYRFMGQNMILSVEGHEPIRLNGMLDRVDWVDRENSAVKIVDYKTMAPKSVNEIMGLTKNSTGSIYRQLVFYKLLTEIDDRFRPSLNKPKYKVTEIESDFLKPAPNGDYKKVGIEIEDSAVEELKVEIVDVMSRIKNLEFDGSEKYPLCDDCEYCRMLSQK